jgi:hypothetical protein
MIGHKRKHGKSKNDEDLILSNDNIMEEQKDIEMSSSKKPLWIPEVKNSLKLFPSSTNILEFEKIEELMNKDGDDILINQENHPFYTTIKKMIYSFGDVKEPNKLTIIKISNFVNKYVSLLIKIIQECDFKKIIEYFYKAEKNKLDSIKKFKHKSLFMNFYEDEKKNFSFENDNDNINEIEDIIKNDNNEDNDDLDDSLNELKIFEEKEKEEEINKNQEDKENEFKMNDSIYEMKDINNIFKETEELNREIAIFQDKRTELMDQKTYEEYIKCRQINFLSRGKKFFQNFLQNNFTEEEKFPNELKEASNIELIAFILNEEIKKIIINSIKEKNPNKKLFILTQPLSPEDIDYFLKKELSILLNFQEKFLNDYSTINEFRKKKINHKVYNKFIKLKKGKNGETFLVIKKYIFIQDPEECEFLSKNKQASEVQVINGILKLREQIIKIKNLKINNREGLRKNKKNEKNKNFIGIKEMIDFIGVDNYYEYFLCKNYVKEINLEEVKINDLTNYISVLNKVNKKKISSKFEEWLNLSNEQKNEIKNEFQKYISKELNFGK